MYEFQHLNNIFIVFFKYLPFLFYRLSLLVLFFCFNKLL